MVIIFLECLFFCLIGVRARWGHWGTTSLLLHPRLGTQLKMMNVCWMNEWIKNLGVNKLSPLPPFDLTSNPFPTDMNCPLLFYFSVLPMGLWPRQSTTLTRAFVALWDLESKMEGRKALKWWKEDSIRWSRAAGLGIITPWTPAEEALLRWRTPDTLTPSGKISLNPVLVKWVSLSILSLQFKCPSGEL